METKTKTETGAKDAVGASARGAAAPAAAKPTGPKPEKKIEEPTPPVDAINKTRRRLVWTSVIGFLTVNFLMFLRFFFPRTLFEPSPIFRIGYPSDYSLGVDTRFQDKYRVWVVRTADRLFVVYARCTHLGCTPNWSQPENKFKCPCHGSGYDMEGVNFEGPAPRPMDRAKVELDAEGQIVVDVSRLYTFVQFDAEGAYLSVS
jgi:cytochrome b6-f complex iron-sulfur subunit